MSRVHPYRAWLWRATAESRPEGRIVSGAAGKAAGTKLRVKPRNPSSLPATGSLSHRF